MSDPRWQQLAEILANYSTGTKKGEKVLITMMEETTFPLTRAVYTEVVKAGGLPHVEFQSVLLERELMLHGTKEQLDWLPELNAYGMEWADVYIGLRGARNPFEFSGIAPENIAAHKKAMGKVSGMRNELTRWVLVRVPNESFAQQAEMSHEEMMDFFFEATLRDWAKEAEWYTEIQIFSTQMKQFPLQFTFALVSHIALFEINAASRASFNRRFIFDVTDYFSPFEHRFATAEDKEQR